MRSGSVIARFTMFTPICSSPSTFSFSRADTQRASATPPPGTMPSSTAARVACMKSVAYWTPIDEPQKSNTLIYILQHPSREEAAANWKSFQDDPEWKSVKEKSELNGKLTENIDSTFLTLTDFSPPLPK